jgi:hypothetical protein
VGPRAGLDRCGKSRPRQDSIPDRPARSQSLYRLRYPAHVLFPKKRNYDVPVAIISSSKVFCHQSQSVTLSELLAIL